MFRIAAKIEMGVCFRGGRLQAKWVFQAGLPVQWTPPTALPWNYLWCCSGKWKLWMMISWNYYFFPQMFKNKQGWLTRGLSTENRRYNLLWVGYWKPTDSLSFCFLFFRGLTNCIWRLLSPNLFSLCCGNASYHIPLEILLWCHLWGLCNLFMQRWGFWGGKFSSFAFRKWGLDLVFFPQSSKLLLLYVLPSGSWERVPVVNSIPPLCFLTNKNVNL